MKPALSECVEHLHAAGYVVLGPENAEETAALLGWITDPLLRDRADAVLAAFPDSFVQKPT